MDIKNIERVQILAAELKELKMCRDLLVGGAYVKVLGNSEETFGTIRDSTVREAVLFSVNKRINDIEKEVETL